ncbi:hypothetical protein QA640_38995 [Bradyrhizobium sp. CB82]|uniref:hypothetical protein n=1 Tax=Bradyrhizobium sp. CB82 TaxID=3039159 RepID=UPI0024B0E5A7|nr:hypothetical protein [Bradyrhizobium sp. CB82]WFU40139.1 hypothetical protein QA640_38995 [Bradyrhizobium sp. CB82]
MRRETIALDLPSQICAVVVSRIDIDPALMHRVAVIGSGTSTFCAQTVVSLLSTCGMAQQSYLDLVLAGVVTELLGLVAVIVLAGLLGAFETARAVT